MNYSFIQKVSKTFSVVILMFFLFNIVEAKEILKPIDSIDIKKKYFFDGITSDGTDLWLITSISYYNIDSLFKVDLKENKVLGGMQLPSTKYGWFWGLVFDSTSQGGPFLWVSNSDEEGKLYKIKFSYIKEYFFYSIVDSFCLPCKYPSGMALYLDTLWLSCWGEDRLDAYDINSNNFNIIKSIPLTTKYLAISVNHNSQVNFWTLDYNEYYDTSYLQLINQNHNGELLSEFEIERYMRCSDLTVDNFSPGGPYFWINCCWWDIEKWKIYKFKIPDVTSIKDYKSGLSKNIISNPNPFSESTTINFNLEANCEVRLSVFNFLGQEIAVLVNEFLPAGQHSAKFDGTNLPQGTYYYKLQAGSEVRTGKVLLMDNAE